MARPSWIAGLLVGLILLAGCTTTPDRGEDPTAPIILSPPPGEEGGLTGTPAVGLGGTPEIVTAELGEVVWTTAVDPAGLPATPVPNFAPDAAAIYAVLPVVRIDAGSTISATWTYNGTSLDALGSSVAVNEARAGGRLEFYLDSTGAELWPDGKYEITVIANVRVIQTVQVRMDNT